MSHDPFAPSGRRHANRVTVGQPGAGNVGMDVPGNERELLAWLAEPVTAGDTDEAARRADEAEARETVRGGDARPAVMDAIEAARAFIRGDSAEVAPAAVVPADHVPAQLLTEVPEGWREAIAWIEAAPEDQRRDYARAAWMTEQGRDTIRKSVRNEVAKYLPDVSPAE